MNRNYFRIGLLSAVLMLVTAAPSYAYLDPGTASVALQAIIGAIAAGAATIGMFWQRVKAFFRRKTTSE